MNKGVESPDESDRVAARPIRGRLAAMENAGRAKVGSTQHEHRYLLRARRQWRTECEPEGRSTQRIFAAVDENRWSCCVEWVGPEGVEPARSISGSTARCGCPPQRLGSMRWRQPDTDGLHQVLLALMRHLAYPSTVGGPFDSPRTSLVRVTGVATVFIRERAAPGRSGRRRHHWAPSQTTSTASQDVGCRGRPILPDRAAHLTEIRKGANGTEGARIRILVPGCCGSQRG
jgi:hypothetical protein